MAEITSAISNFGNIGSPLPSSALRKDRSISDWDAEIEALARVSRNWLSQAQSFEIITIDHRYGFALESPDAEGIVVTEETYPTAVDINKLRALNGEDQLLILVIPFVYDEKGIIISSRRIRQQLATKYSEAMKK